MSLLPKLYDIFTFDIWTHIKLVDRKINKLFDFESSVESFESKDQNFVGFVNLHLFGSLDKVFTFVAIPFIIIF